MKKLIHAKTTTFSELNYHRKSKNLKKSSSLGMENTMPKETPPTPNPCENLVDYGIINYLSLFKDYLLLVHSKSDQIAKSLNEKTKIPIKSKRKLLIFDLDETLIYTDAEKLNSTLRPKTHEMLEALSFHYDLAVWTASEMHYANQIIDELIDPLGKLFTYKLFRAECVQITDELFIKDFRIFDGIDLKRVILIDNQLISFATNLENGFLCDSFYGNMDDNELPSIADFFIKYKDESDLPELLNRMFHLKDTIEQILKSK